MLLSFLESEAFLDNLSTGEPLVKSDYIVGAHADSFCVFRATLSSPSKDTMRPLPSLVTFPLIREVVVVESE